MKINFVGEPESRVSDIEDAREILLEIGRDKWEEFWGISLSEDEETPFWIKEEMVDDVWWYNVWMEGPESVPERLCFGFYVEYEEE